MAEYIERESLVQAIEDSWRNNPHSDPKVRQVHNHEHQHFLVLASKQPTADVVPVVRCKDCKRAEMYQFGCGDTEHLACVDIDEESGQITFAQAVEPDHYCSYGERRCEE